MEFLAQFTVVVIVVHLFIYRFDDLFLVAKRHFRYKSIEHNHWNFHIKSLLEKCRMCRLWGFKSSWRERERKTENDVDVKSH